jgi:hypothetical protein
MISAPPLHAKPSRKAARKERQTQAKTLELAGHRR